MFIIQNPWDKQQQQTLQTSLELMAAVRAVSHTIAHTASPETNKQKHYQPWE